MSNTGGDTLTFTYEESTSRLTGNTKQEAGYNYSERETTTTYALKVNGSAKASGASISVSDNVTLELTSSSSLSWEQGSRIEYSLGTIPEDVTSFGGYVFNGCTSLNYLKVPSTVIKLSQPGAGYSGSELVIDSYYTYYNKSYSNGFGYSNKVYVLKSIDDGTAPYFHKSYTKTGTEGNYNVYTKNS